MFVFDVVSAACVCPGRRIKQQSKQGGCMRLETAFDRGMGNTVAGAVN